VSVLDVILLVLVGVFMIRGLLRGFVRETIGLVALLAAGLLAALYAAPVGEALVARGLVREEIAPAVAGGGVFLAVDVAVTLLGLLLDRLLRALFLGPLLRLAGMLFAAVKGGLLLGLALSAGQRFAPWLLTPAQLASSRLAKPMMSFATVALDFGSDWIEAALKTGEGATT
jgi:membrane protein required for colicin V production